ncbi:HisA/HisF-related TIM barrel protein [Novipirellula artificiosorum]|uniref:1-(5-phosphoribosyl)-5-[(5-phosphoribosylamino)methylideneamino] imidazole-4-carboxamide isomerase n=1 Tax=Novipirellula artificiosorum TaxID=2528016 RepID=A0A5C6DP90_9BACT|nr:HisA/HisF-related TIM barrel protein [Novipirellula artificiosorum]TWU38422.1 1-(5-phosphoribosyl)-5-[(5-phosphoribosylamino)methylideneamino] imidazole-4-carboxamide isomerase [Novipirellula artificiosorum]
MQESNLWGQRSSFQGIASRLIAVIDLKASVAVHAIAGNRLRYQPVWLCGSSPGDPIALADHYRKVGVGAFYIADLDAIVGGDIQLEVLHELLLTMDANARVMLDAGVGTHDGQRQYEALIALSEQHPLVSLIVATECATGLANLDQFVREIGAAKVILGLDYHAGHFLAGVSSETGWLDHANRLGIRRAVVLDTSAVGTRSGPVVVDTCRRVGALVPDWSITAGGGIRSADDANTLFDAGCDHCLLATALLPPRGVSA